jgi:hypothetical protein
MVIGADGSDPVRILGDATQSGHDDFREPAWRP